MTYVGPVETWATILAVAATAVAGDVLTAGAMRKIGDLDVIRAKSGYGWGDPGGGIEPDVSAGRGVDGAELFCAAVYAVECGGIAGGTGERIANISGECLCGEVFSEGECGPAAMAGGAVCVRRGVSAGEVSYGFAAGAAGRGDEDGAVARDFSHCSSWPV